MRCGLAVPIAVPPHDVDAGDGLARFLAGPVDERRIDESRGNAETGERGMRAFTAVDQALTALERYAGVKVVADWLVLQL